MNDTQVSKRVWEVSFNFDTSKNLNDDLIQFGFKLKRKTNRVIDMKFSEMKTNWLTDLRAAIPTTKQKYSK